MKSIFDKVISVGHRVDGTLWEGITDGYTASREITMDDGINPVITCSVRADGEKPLFMCGEERSYHSGNATTVMKA